MEINRKVAVLLVLIISVSFISMPISAADQPYMKAALADLSKAQIFSNTPRVTKAGIKRKPSVWF